MERLEDARVAEILAAVLEVGEGDSVTLEDGAFALSMEMENATYVVVVHNLQEADLLMVTVQAPLEIAEGHRAAMMEFAIRANYEMNLVTFDLDLDDGKLLARAAVPSDESDVGTDQFAKMMLATIAAFEHYYPAIAMVLDGAAPSQALATLQDGDDEA
jgi:hypothetical protein